MNWSMKIIRARNIAAQDIYATRQPSEIDINYLWKRLAPLLGYLQDRDHKTQVYKALMFAFHAHRHQKRKSGEPFITHPLEVTRILAEMKLDHECLVAGLLHDTGSYGTMRSVAELYAKNDACMNCWLFLISTK